MDIQGALDEVVFAMERLGQAFLKEIDGHRQAGRSEEDLKRLGKGADAMRDAAGIYLTWAHHYVNELNAGDSEDEKLFDPDEGGSLV